MEYIKSASSVIYLNFTAQCVEPHTHTPTPQPHTHTDTQPSNLLSHVWNQQQDICNREFLLDKKINKKVDSFFVNNIENWWVKVVHKFLNLTHRLTYGSLGVVCARGWPGSRWLGDFTQSPCLSFLDSIFHAKLWGISCSFRFLM